MGISCLPLDDNDRQGFPMHIRIFSDSSSASPALGITGGVIEHQVTTPGKLANIATSCLTTALAANITLNLFTTVFIISRLILYRRMVKNSFGVRREEHLHHTRVVGMLLESAAINVPITVIALVGIATWSSYGDFMMSVVTPGQVSCTSIPYCSGAPFLTV